MAHQMHEANTRDLAWWDLPLWMPAWRRVLVGGLVSGLLSGVLFAVLGGLAGHPVLGFVGGFMLGPGGAIFDAYIVRGRGHQEKWAVGHRIGMGYVLANVLIGLLTGVLLDGATDGALVGLAVGFGVGFVGALGVHLLIRALGFNSRPAAPAGSHLTPAACWRQDGRQALAFGFLLGATTALTLGVVCLLVGEPLTRVALAVVPELVLMTAFAVMFSLRAVTTLAVIQLWGRGNSPLRLIRFLEDARERNILRCAGPVYQVRHARLRDVLARSYQSSERNKDGPGGARRGGWRRRNRPEV